MNSLEKVNKLPAVFSDLQEYVIEEKENYTKLKIPMNLIGFDRDVILANFEDAIIHWEAGSRFNIIELFHKQKNL